MLNYSPLQQQLLDDIGINTWFLTLNLPTKKEDEALSHLFEDMASELPLPPSTNEVLTPSIPLQHSKIKPQPAIAPIKIKLEDNYDSPQTDNISLLVDNEINAPTWESLAQALATDKYVLNSAQEKAILGVGNQQAEIMIITDTPSEQNIIDGQILNQKSTELLTNMLAVLDVTLPQVYLTHVVKFQPAQNRDPLPDEIKAHLSYLQAQIALIQPNLIISTGRIASQALLNTKAPLTKLRNKNYRLSPNSIPVLVLPAMDYLLRVPADKRNVWQEIKLLKTTLSNKNDRC